MNVDSGTVQAQGEVDWEYALEKELSNADNTSVRVYSAGAPGGRLTLLFTCLPGSMTVEGLLERIQSVVDVSPQYASGAYRVQVRRDKFLVLNQSIDLAVGKKAAARPVDPELVALRESVQALERRISSLRTEQAPAPAAGLNIVEMAALMKQVFELTRSVAPPAAQTIRERLEEIKLLRDLAGDFAQGGSSRSEWAEAISEVGKAVQQLGAMQAAKAPVAHSPNAAPEGQKMIGKTPTLHSILTADWVRDAVEQAMDAVSERAEGMAELAVESGEVVGDYAADLADALWNEIREADLVGQIGALLERPVDEIYGAVSMHLHALSRDFVAGRKYVEKLVEHLRFLVAGKLDGDARREYGKGIENAKRAASGDGDE